MIKLKFTHLVIIALIAITAACRNGGSNELNDSTSKQEMQENKCGGKTSCSSSNSKCAYNEAEFYNSLSTAGQRKFDQLDTNHRQMAIEMTREGGNPNKAVMYQYVQQTGQH